MARLDLVDSLDTGSGRVRLDQLNGDLGRRNSRPDEPPTLNVCLVQIDTSAPTKTPQGVENLDLHALSDLHQQLEAERRGMPGELVVPGKVSGLAVAMLIDSGSSVSVMSTALWDHIHRSHPGWTLFPTDCRIRTVSGVLATVRGRVAVEVELAGQFCVC